MSDALFFLRGYRRQTVLLLVVLVATTALDTLTLAAIYPLLSSIFGGPQQEAAGIVLGTLDRLVHAVPTVDPTAAALGFFLVLVPLNTSGKILREWLQSHVSAEVTYDVKRRVFQRFLVAPYGYFLDHSAAELTYRVSVAPQNLAVALVQVALLATYGLTIAGTLTVLLSIHAIFTVAMLVVGGAFFLANRYIAHRFSTSAGHAKLSAQTAALGTVQVFLSGHRDIAVAASGERWMRRFLQQSDVYRKFFVRDYTWASLPALLLEFLVFVLGAVVVGAMRMLAPDTVVVLLPVLAVYVYAVRQLLSTLGTASRQALRLAGLSPDVALLRGALSEPEPGDMGGARTDTNQWSRIALESVTFTYPGHTTPALDNVTFTIERGATTAIVGPSGGGKTTLLLLLLRLLTPSSGRILLDQTDIAEFRVRAWRERIGYVGHEPFLFDGTVAENITFGFERDRAQVERAARAAYADEFIRALPGGYDTVLGEGGMTLSAGQRQRVVIARALLREPTVLILDEPTSALDATSERLIRHTLRELAGTCTTVVAAHRLATIQSADHIVVLDRGRVVEQGRHADLLPIGGAYAELAAASAPEVKG